MYVRSIFRDYYDAEAAKSPQPTIYRRDVFQKDLVKGLAFGDATLPSLKLLTEYSHMVGVPYTYQWVYVCGKTYLGYRKPTSKFAMTSLALMPPEKIRWVLNRIRARYLKVMDDYTLYYGAEHATLRSLSVLIQNPIFTTSFLQAGDGCVYEVQPNRIESVVLQEIGFPRIMRAKALVAKLTKEIDSMFEDDSCHRYLKYGDWSGCQGCSHTTQGEGTPTCNRKDIITAKTVSSSFAGDLVQ